MATTSKLDGLFGELEQKRKSVEEAQKREDQQDARDEQYADLWDGVIRNIGGTEDNYFVSWEADFVRLGRLLVQQSLDHWLNEFTEEGMFGAAVVLLRQSCDPSTSGEIVAFLEKLHEKDKREQTNYLGDPNSGMGGIRSALTDVRIALRRAWEGKGLPFTPADQPINREGRGGLVERTGETPDSLRGMEERKELLVEGTGHKLRYRFNDQQKQAALLSTFRPKKSHKKPKK